MDLQSLFTTSTGTSMAMWIGEHMPPRVGYSLVRLACRYIARSKVSPLNRAIRLNQSVARGLPWEAPELDRAVYEVLFNAGRGYYELYHRLRQGVTAALEVITISEEMERMTLGAGQDGRGLVLVTTHMGNFDVGMIALGKLGLTIQAISYATPPGGYELQNQMRADAGYLVTPASGAAAKMALDRLKQGGIVATGIDRPFPDSAKTVPFFGLPSPLPTGYVRLAAATNSRLVLIWLEPRADGGYTIEVDSEVDLIDTGHRAQDTKVNAEEVLARAEVHIREHPGEWSLFHPVWPQLMPDEA